MQQTKSFGSWKSPITSDLIVAGAIRLSEIQLDGEDVYWIEGRAAEKGRNVIVRRTPDGKIEDAIHLVFNARTRVHEYGGGSYAVKNKSIIFTHFTDQNLILENHAKAGMLTGNADFIEPKREFRFADGVFDNSCSNFLCVREQHNFISKEPENSLLGINLKSIEETVEETILISGADFYSSPRLNPDNSKLAFLSWNHPNMPWEATELFIGEFTEDNPLANIQHIAGSKTESICQPEWSPNGILHFVSDRTGWWNLYRYVDGNIEALYPMEAEFGVPHWVFRQSQYAFIDETHSSAPTSKKEFSNLGF